MAMLAFTLVQVPPALHLCHDMRGWFSAVREHALWAVAEATRPARTANLEYMVKNGRSLVDLTRDECVLDG